MKQTPSIKDKTITDKMTHDETEEFQKLRALVELDDTDREQWKLKMITAANQRLGVKRVSNYPYEGAPDIPLPETDKLIKKSTPNLVLSAWSPKNMCTVEVAPGIEATPELKEKARKTQLAMNMILRKKMNWYQKLELAADYAKEKGHCLFKTIERFISRPVRKVLDLDEYSVEVIDQLKAASNEDLKQFIWQRFQQLDSEDEDDKKVCTEIIKQFRDGETVIEFDVDDISSLPDIEIPDPVKIIVPPYTTRIEHCNRYTEEFVLTRHELQERMDQEIYLDRDIDDLKFTKGSDSDINDQNKQMSQGITDSSSVKDLFCIRETYCWYKEKDEYSRWVFTYFKDIGDPEVALLRRKPFPFEFQEWNLDRYDNEIKGDNHYESRGTPEQIRAIQEVMERSMNNMLIRDEHNNMPIWEVLDTSEILQRDTGFRPGDMVPVSQIGSEVRPMTGPANVDFSSDRVMQLMKAYAEEYMGNVDQLFRNATNQGGGKTLGEIKEGIKQTSGPLNVEVIRWNETLSKVYTKVFDIMKERMGEDLVINGVTVTKEDFNFPSEVKANGTLEISDKDLATQKAMSRIQVAQQMIQLGVANSEDLYNAYVDWLEKDGVKNPDMFATNPKQMMQEQIGQMQQQVQQLTQQAGQVGEQVQKGQKELAKLQEKAKEEIAKFQGKREALSAG